MPERVGPYRVHGQLGAGGVGVVYEAEDESLGRRVAVKVLLDASPANQARFDREARAMGRVNHPNVATVYDVGEADGQSYIAMELVRGQTLREWLELTRSCSEALAVLRQAGLGLVAAHEAGLVHRDFKPDNVLVGDDGRVRVVDFGLAKHHAELSASLATDTAFDRDALARELADGGITRTGSLMGTPAYMAPEQFRGCGDARSDQFGFCVVIYEALYGRLPFPGETAEALYDATSSGRLRPWPSDTDVPVGVRTVLRRGLRADADDRFPSMAALLQALDHALERAVGRGEPKRRHHTKGPRSWRWKVVGATTGLLLALGSTAWQSFGRDDAGEGDPMTARSPAAERAPERTVEPQSTRSKKARDKKTDAVHARTGLQPHLRDRPRGPAQS